MSNYWSYQWVGMLLAQQTELIEQHGFAVWVAVILLGGLVASVAFLGRWFLALQPKALEELAKAVEKSSDEHSRAIDLLTISVMGMSQRLLTHDLTVRGLNPATGEDFDERDSKALPICEECRRQMEDVIQHLKENSRT